MDTSGYLINEFGLDMASEKVTREMSKLIENKNDPDFKGKLEKLIIDREEILKGNMEVIKKYVGDVKIG